MALFRFLHALSGKVTWVCAWVCVAFLMAAMAVTITDVVLRWISRGVGMITGENLSLAVLGVVDIVQLFILAAAYMAIPYAFSIGSHVGVDIVVQQMSQRSRALLAAMAALLSAVLMFLILIYCTEQAFLQHGYGDRSLTVGIPIIWYWLPILVGSALSVFATVLVAVENFAFGFLRLAR
ncbi:MAG: TRAP transporter small permease subunit [Marinosulfonomonas sp.]|nr:TRAP transporter small permease subunit [Marinosulfonomonas sp.]